MQIRKLVKSGNSSLVVAIPRDWIKRNKLKQGNFVYIDEKKNTLSMRTELKEKLPENSKIVINIDGKSERIISRDINSAYLDNYHYIIIKGNELKKKTDSIKKMISDLIAIEIIDESSNKIVAKNFLNIYDTEPKVVIRRMDNIIRSMIMDTKDAANDHEIVANIVNRDKGINRLNYLISKIVKVANNDKSILGSLNLSEMDILRYWELNSQLEKIGDRIKNIARLMPKVEPKHRKDCLMLFSQIENMYKNVMKAFYNFSVKLSDDISSDRKLINDNIKKFIKNSNCATCSQIAINAFNMTGHINDIGRIIRYLD